MSSQITIKGKQFNLPTFFPDATRGVIRSLDSHDLQALGVEGLIVNTYHLMSKPGTTVVKDLGGIKKLMNWPGWIISDSGGFQLLSMIYKDPTFGKINRDGVIFYKDSKGGKQKYNFTPEKSIQTQFALDADIMICLDDCPAAGATHDDELKSVERTIEWAKRCKQEFETQIKSKKLSDDNRPLLFAVIQGGNHKDLRQLCAEKLVEIGFDGYGFGGWPLDEQGVFNNEILQFTADLLPKDKPKYALGVGNPQAIFDCYKMGWNIFDCVLPTRDARHARLYIFNENICNQALDPKTSAQVDTSSIYSYLYIKEEKYNRDASPIDQHCDCHTCQNYSRAYLKHLFDIEDAASLRLATIHNLNTYQRLIKAIREKK
jgi:queuine tRNA-ribosyltransferase